MTAGGLKAGDMCVIVDGGHIPEMCMSAVGKTVTLSRMCDHEFHHSHAPENFLPFWKCAGISPDRCVSWMILRKIPPAPMDDSIDEEDNEYRYCPTGTTALADSVSHREIALPVRR